MRRLRFRRRGEERGAALVEFAFAAPILVLLLSGIFEFGIAWQDAAVVERAAQNGGRAASNGAVDRLADFDALRSVDSTLSGGRGLSVKKVVIYEADSADGEPPVSCVNASTAGSPPYGPPGQNCNVYGPAQIGNSNYLVGFGADDTSCDGDWDSHWCPLDRDNTRPVSDYVGVYVEVDYSPVTRLWPTGATIKRNAVYLIEPPIAGG